MEKTLPGRMVPVPQAVLGLCSGCQFWQYLSGPTGECRKENPRLDTAAGPDLMSRMGRFPLTLLDGWCGAYLVRATTGSPMPGPKIHEWFDDEKFVPESMWLEAIDNQQPGGGGSDSLGSSDYTLCGYIPWAARRSFRQYALGYSYCDTATPFQLHRDLPLRHPSEPQLRAAAVSIVGMCPQYNSVAAAQYVVSTATSTVLGTLATMFGDSGSALAPRTPRGFVYDDGFDPGTDLRTARYSLAYATIKFRNFRCNFLPDTDIYTGGKDDSENEWKRNVYFETQAGIKVLAAEGGQFLQFVEGEEGEHPPIVHDSDGTKKATIAAPWSLLQGETKITMFWLNVPHDYLSNDTDILYPLAFQNCLGKVNSEAFLGCRAGTLYMDPPEFTPVPYVYPISGDYGQLKSWDVKVTFNLYDPQLGAAAPITHGHNTLPWRLDNYNYLATRDGTVTGPRLMLEANFWNIFRAWNNPR